MVGRKRGGDIMQELTNNLNDILIDPPKYQQDLAKYAWEQATIYGYGGTLGQFLSTLGLGHIFQQGSGILDKAQDKLTKSGVAGSQWHVDFKTGVKLVSNPDTWKIPSKKEANMKMRVDAL